MGGFQSTCIAALDNDVDTINLSIPWMCDVFREEGNRIPATFMPEAKETSSVPSLLRLPGCGPLRWIRSRLAEQQQIASILTKAPGTAVVPGAFRPLPAPVLLPPLTAGTAEQPAAPSAALQSLYSRATPCPPGTPPPAWRPPAACFGGAVLGLT